MTLSRTATVLMLVAPMPLPAMPPNAQDALQLHQKSIALLDGARCPDADNPLDPNDVVVCGRREQSRFRLPLPVTPAEGTRVVGDIASPTDALKPSNCEAVGPHQSCGGTIPILPVIGFFMDLVEEVADPDD